MHNSDPPLLNSTLEPLAEPKRIDLRRGPITTNNLHNALLCPPQPLRAGDILFPRPIVRRKLRATGAVLKPILARAGDSGLGVLAQRDTGGLGVPPCLPSLVFVCEGFVESEG